jgi:formate dehydrogenase subunit delta
MSAENLAKLVRMANQIAAEFEGQRGDAVAATAGHIQKFWSRTMRRDLLRQYAAGGGGLSPTARAAVARLAEASAPVGAAS